MDYLELPVTSAEIDVSAEENLKDVDEAWDGVMELLFDEEAKAFARQAKGEGIPAPNEDYIGYEVEGDDGEVIATIEIAWPDEKVGYMTSEQLEDKEIVERVGWHIVDLLSITDVVKYFGGNN